MRSISFAMIFVCNAMQINFSAKCLDQASSVVAVVTITGLNFFFSVSGILNSLFFLLSSNYRVKINILNQAILGWLCFGELLNMSWFCGAFFIVLGLYLIHSVSPPPNTTKVQKSKKKEKEN